MKTTPFTDLLNGSRGIIIGASVTKKGKIKIKTQIVQGGLGKTELAEVFKQLTGDKNAS